MTDKEDLLFGALIIILQCVSFGMVAPYFHQYIDPPECTKSFLPDTACMTGSSIDRQVCLVLCISPICSVVAIVLTIQSLFRKNGHIDIVVPSWIGISTFSAGLSCFSYICLWSIMRWKLSTNGCEHPDDNFLETVLIVGVGTGCHIISTLLFGIWRIIDRKNSSFLRDNNRGNNNGESLSTSIWIVSNHMTAVHTLSYSQSSKTTAILKSAVY